jgi:methylmalonyl-CoA mutase N-terminal domain/subunit
VRDVDFATMSGIPLDAVYGAADGSGEYPGQYPYTRGPYASMYRSKLWTMRMFAGFGRPEDTNLRFKYLLKEGQTGLSTAFDMPALMGYDPDHPMSAGEVGREGVSAASMDDFGRLYDEIDLEAVSVSMTISGPAPVALALFVAAAERRGFDRTGEKRQCHTGGKRFARRHKCPRTTRNGRAEPYKARQRKLPTLRNATTPPGRTTQPRRYG